MDRNLESLFERMEQVVHLPADDPSRLAVVRQVAETGGEAERLWLALLREDEQLRLALQRVAPPADLKQRLGLIPHEAAAAARRFASVRRVLAAAAAVVMIAGLWLALDARRAPRDTPAKQALALMAVTHHKSHSALKLATGDIREFQAWVSTKVPFPAIVPNLGEGFELLGGGPCSLGGHAVVYTRWRKGEREYSLYQFCTPNYDLPSDMPRQTVRPAAPWRNDRHGQRVIIWKTPGAEDCAYALVAADDDPLLSDPAITGRPK